MKKIILFIAAVVAFNALNAQKIIGPQKVVPEQKLRFVEQIIERFYVDSVDAEHVVEEGIIAMLKTLDPHSLYSNPEETRALTEPLQGNFSGIGIQFNMATDTLYVIQTVAGGPSEKVGILAGDRILTANDTLISGVKMNTADVMKHLRGPKGSVVDLGVLRSGSPEVIKFRVVRDDIPLYSVDAAYMVDGNTGFIRVSKFAETTADEVKKAIADLRKKGMKNLIIDLESNGGGYLNAAHEFASIFLDKGDMVVYTDGEKVAPAYYRTESAGDMRDGRVVVMVNQYSASASEILAGALQDNDRGVIVGRRTFGKGLVQRPFPLPDGSMVRLTTARYYTPSGRSIQKPYKSGDDDAYQLDMLHRYESGEFLSADSVHFADSLRFKTLKSGRTVYGGGGIMPDRFVPVDTSFYSNYYRDLVAKGVINRYSLNYLDAHRKALKSTYRNEDDFVKKFEVTPEMLNSLIELGKKEGVEYDEAQFETSKKYIATILKALIGRDLFELSTYYRIVNPLSPTFNEAVKLISSPDEYESLLSAPK